MNKKLTKKQIRSIKEGINIAIMLGKVRSHLTNARGFYSRPAETIVIYPDKHTLMAKQLQEKGYKVDELALYLETALHEFIHYKRPDMKHKDVYKLAFETLKRLIEKHDLEDVN